MKKTTGESHKSDLVTLELPAEFINKYLELLRPLDETIEYDIQKKLDQHIGSPEMGGELYGQGKPFNSQDPEAMQDQLYRPVHHETKKLQGSGLVLIRFAERAHVPCF